MTEHHHAVRRLWEKPDFEILPFRSALNQTDLLPGNATIAVTASPTKGMEPTIRYATELARRGFQVIPHIAARSVEGTPHLARILDAIGEAGINQIFVVAGDNTNTEAFPDSLSLLRAAEELDYSLPRLGVAAYPDGHPFISKDALIQALKNKQQYASYMTTQMCFDPASISNWVSAMRSQGITLPIHLGMPGVAPIQRLISISAKIGVRASARYLSKHKGLSGRLLRWRPYTPGGLSERLSELIANPVAGIEALHFFTFNQVESCESWRRNYLTAAAG